MQNNTPTYFDASSSDYTTSLDFSIAFSETGLFGSHRSHSTIGTSQFSSASNKAHFPTTGDITGAGSGALVDVVPLSGTNQLHHHDDVNQRPQNDNSGSPHLVEELLQHIGTQFSHRNHGNEFDDIQHHHNNDDPLLSAINNGIRQRKKDANIPPAVYVQGRFVHEVYRHWINDKWIYRAEIDTTTVLVDSYPCLSPPNSPEVPSGCQGACLSDFHFGTDGSRRFICHLFVGCNFEAPATEIQALVDHLFTHQQPVEIASTAHYQKKRAQKYNIPGKYRCRRPNCTREEGFSRSDNRNTHEKTCKGGDIIVDSVKAVPMKRMKRRDTPQPTSPPSTDLPIESRAATAVEAQHLSNKPYGSDSVTKSIEGEDIGPPSVHFPKRQRLVQYHSKSSALQNIKPEDQSPVVPFGVLPVVQEVSGGLTPLDSFQDYNLRLNTGSSSRFSDSAPGFPTFPGRKDPSNSITNADSRNNTQQPVLASPSERISAEGASSTRKNSGRRRTQRPSAREEVVSRPRPPSTGPSAISWPASSFLPPGSFQTPQSTIESSSRIDSNNQVPVTFSAAPYSGASILPPQTPHWQARTNAYDEAFITRHLQRNMRDHDGF